MFHLSLDSVSISFFVFLSIASIVAIRHILGGRESGHARRVTLPAIRIVGRFRLSPLSYDKTGALDVWLHEFIDA